MTEAAAASTMSEQSASPSEAAAVIRGFSRREILTRDLRYMPSWRVRLACKSLMQLGRRWVTAVHNPERVMPAHDPFILVMNHNQRPEALLIPALSAWLRNGKLVQFVADWQFLMVPLIGWFFRAGDTIIVGRKDARPKFLNVLKRRLVDPTPVFDQMEERIRLGMPLALFPEGTMHRDPEVMRPGRTGAARLAIATGAPLLPAGIRFPGHRPGTPIGDLEPFEIEFGEFIHPDSSDHRNDWQSVNLLHQRMMEEISRLCGKRWERSRR